MKLKQVTDVTKTASEINSTPTATETNALVLNKSAGIVTLPSITNNNNGSVTIGTNGIIAYFPTADAKEQNPIRLLATTGATLTLTNNATNYVYSDYNAGSPIFLVTLNPNDFLVDGRKVPVYRVVRENNTLHILNYDEYGVALSNKAYFKDVALHSFERLTGLVLSTAATRISTISAGKVYFGVTLVDVNENKAGVSGLLFEYYLTGGNWNPRRLVTSYDSNYYSNGTDRVVLDNNKWVSKYFWICADGGEGAYFIHGNQYNTQAEALAEPIPSLPPLLSSHALFVGKIVIQKGATNGVAYTREWGAVLQNSVATSHNSLTNIDQAGVGILNGHISDQTQLLVGQKSFKGSTNDGSTAIIAGLDSDTNTVFHVDTNGIGIFNGIGANNTNYLSLSNTAIVPSVNNTLTLGSNTNLFVNTYTKAVSSDVDLTINTGTNKTLILAQPVWVDLDFPIIVRTTGPNVPELTTMIGNITAPLWEVNDYNVCEGQESPHFWVEGTPFSWHIHLVTNGLDTSDRYVRFEVEYSWANDLTVLSTPITLDSTDLLIPANTPSKTMLRLNLGSFTPTGGKIGSHTWARLKRISSVGAAPSNSPWITMLQAHIQIDGIGSRFISSK